VGSGLGAARLPIVQSADGLRSVTGGVDASNLGGLSISNSFAPGGVLSRPYLRFPVVAGSGAAVPEPRGGEGMLVGCATLVIAVRRRCANRPGIPRTVREPLGKAGV
jgi:hypothetical protein